MSSADALQLHGIERDRALENMNAQMRAWDMTVPQCEPLVLDFGLNDFGQIGLIEFWLANEIDAGYCGKYFYMQDGQACPLHSHRIKHETFYVVQGQIEVTLNGQTTPLLAGQMMAIPPHQVHGFKAIGNTMMLEMSMPCDVADNYFEDPRIAQWLQNALGVG